MAWLKNITHRYPPKHVFQWLIAILVFAFLFHAVLANALTSEKSDGECTGLETAGRCADKPLTPVPPAEKPVSQNVPDTELPQFTEEGNWGK